MKLLFSFLKQLLPAFSMFAGGVIPITLTAKALTSSIPANDTSKSLTIEQNTSLLNERNIHPTPAPITTTETKNTVSDQGSGSTTKNNTGASGESGSPSGSSEDGKQTEVQEKQKSDESATSPEKPATQPASTPSQTAPQAPQKPARKISEASRLRKLLRQFQKDKKSSETTSASDLASQIIQQLSSEAVKE